MPPAKSPDRVAVEVTAEAVTLSSRERRAQKIIRRHKRDLRKSWAEGYLTGICAGLGPKDLVIDCGANVGVVTAQLAATGAKVIAFEPAPETFAILAEKFGTMQNVTLINAAVGTAKGKVHLKRASEYAANPASASVKSTILEGGRGIDGENSVEVDLIDFPAFIREHTKHTPIAFLKLDIEGAELELLEVMEAQGLFKNVRSLVAETHERKFAELRPRFRALRQSLAEKYPSTHVNLDWI